jgi:hypothetical protein
MGANVHTTRKARDMFRRKTGSEQVYRIADSRHIYKTQTLEDDKRVQLSDKIHTKPLKFKDDILVDY